MQSPSARRALDAASHHTAPVAPTGPSRALVAPDIDE
jgi:hypothetical protein